MFAELPALCGWGGGVSVGDSKSLLSANLTFMLCGGGESTTEEPVPAYCGETAPESTCFSVRTLLSPELFPFRFIGDLTCSLWINS